MDQLANADDAAMFGHDLGNLRIVPQHMHAGKNRQMVHDLAVLSHRIRQRNAMDKMRQFIILDTMAGRNMHKSSALISGDLIGKQHRHFMVIAMTMHRVMRDCAGYIGALERC